MAERLKLRLDSFASPLGLIRLVHDGEALRALDFEDFDARMHRLLGRHYDRYDLTFDPAPDAILGKLGAYFDGDLASIDRIPVVTGGTPFQCLAWAALRDDPGGRDHQLRRPGAAHRQAARRSGHRPR